MERSALIRKSWPGITLAVAALLLLFLVDPTTAAWLPPCPFRLLTGLDCPGCGSSRGLHALLHGNVATAADHNLLLLPALFLLAVGIYYRITGKAGRLWTLLNKPVLLLWIICLFWLLRNIPGHPLSWLNASW